MTEVLRLSNVSLRRDNNPILADVNWTVNGDECWQDVLGDHRIGPYAPFRR